MEEKYVEQREGAEEEKVEFLLNQLSKRGRNG